MSAAGVNAEAERACYLVPLRWQTDGSRLAELTGYLRQISTTCDVLVVDGSPAPVFTRHHRQWAAFARHIRPDPALTYLNGKVNGVITGVRAAAAERVVVADDDVRYDDRSLAEVLALLDDADIVVPQNYFGPLPWHAAWDSARILINRAFGTDYPGTLPVCRSAFLAAACYDGDVLFENLELMRTLQASGARLARAPHILVRRLPPDLRHFAGQRVREAYDSFAQPPRLAVELMLLPGAVFAALTHRYRALAVAAGLTAGLAETGRRRNGGAAVFPRYLPLLAPAWLAERSVCSWLAVWCRLHGGVSYAGRRLPRAATSAHRLRRRAHALSVARGPEPGQRVRTVAERLEA
ncbi:MAG TPA: glycosyltransferase [Streptosporangiaceae bacterium]